MGARYVIGDWRAVKGALAGGAKTFAKEHDDSPRLFSIIARDWRNVNSNRAKRLTNGRIANYNREGNHKTPISEGEGVGGVYLRAVFEGGVRWMRRLRAMGEAER